MITLISVVQDEIFVLLFYTSPNNPKFQPSYVFENTVGKGENDDIWHPLLFPLCFLPF